MAWTPPTERLRQRVEFLRRPLSDDGGESGDGDGAGNFERELTRLCARDARLLPMPMRGGETVLAGRLQGVDVWELTVRSCSQTRTLGPGDVARDARDPRQTFNIRSSLDLEGRGRWLVMTVERGRADG